jgi:purine-binding chemotaxis protein CheW
LESVEESTTVTASDYLIVRCGGKRYGLPAVNCREVLKLPRLVRVPRLPLHLCGIFNLRGEIVAVTDICPLLGQSAQSLHDSFRLVIIEERTIKTALLVEVVEGLSSISLDQVERLVDGAGTGALDLIAGKVIQGECLLVLLNLARLLEHPEMVVNQKVQSEAKS